MVIRKMNTVLVKHNKILFGIFSVIIIVAFVWFFTPGLDGSMFFGGAGNSPNAVVGTVFGRKITNKEYQQAFRDRLIVLEAMTGREGYQFQNYLEQTLFYEMSREVAAEVMGISATDEEVTNFIRNACALFRGKNGFDPELYRKFANVIQEREGRSIADFENIVRRMLAAEKLSSVLTSGVYLTPDELDRMAVLLKEKFNARMIEFPFSAYKNVKRGSEEAKKQGLGENDMLNYFRANQKHFMTEPQLKALVVVFPYTPVNYAPSAQEIRKYYDSHKQDFRKDGKDQPLAQVRNKIAEAIRQAKAVESAVAKAKKFREDLYTATESAETAEAQIAQLKKLAAKQKLKLTATDWFTAGTAELKGIGKEPELVAALFRTNPKHNPLLTASFKGNQGAYVAASCAALSSVPADYKDVKDKVWEMLLNDHAARLASEAAYNFSHLVAGRKDAGKELKALAQQAGAKVTDLNGFTREASAEAPARMQAMQTAVELADQTISRPVKTPNGMILVYLDSRIQPTAAEKAEAGKMLEGLLRYSKQMMQQGTVNLWMQSNSQSRIKPDHEH